MTEGERAMRMLPKHIWNLWVFGMLLGGALAVVGMAQALEVGEQAPDFTLPSTTGEQISLSQFQGKKLVLLEFHVNDFGAT
jgi:mannose/fructose/N-acetylgalactosamine-specific phosphotransferase system component IIC